MRNKMKKILSLVLAGVLAVSVLAPAQSYAAAKPALSATKMTLSVGEAKRLTVKNTKAKVKWSSSDKKVATVNSKGVVTAVDKGTATIKAYNKATKKSYTCKVEVKRKSFSLYNSMEPWAGYPETEGCSFYHNPELNTQLKKELGDTISKSTTWTSSDESILVVIQDGKCLVTIGFGNVTLTAKSGKKTFVYDVEVTDVDPFAMSDKDFDVVNVSFDGYTNFIEAEAASAEIEFFSNYKENQKLETPRGIKLGSTLEEVYDAYGIEDTMNAGQFWNLNDETHTATKWVIYHYANHERKDCHTLSFVFDQNGEVMSISYGDHDYKWHAKK